MDGTFITSTAIPGTTGSRTLKLSAHPSNQGSNGPSGLLASSHASNAAPKERPSSFASNSTVASSVSAVRSIDARVPVFNLEVEAGYLPEYFANGILVHNCAMTTAGYAGTKSPNRLDAMVWAITELFPKIILQARKDEERQFPGINRERRVNTGHSSIKDRLRR